jgi:hypothetical protein
MAYITAKHPAAQRVALYDGGAFSTPPGTTKVVGTPSDTPVRRRVRLHDQPSGRLLREAWSDAVTGAYQFTGLRSGVFYVTSFDHTGIYSGVIETDVVVPAP